ncbi:hypothetical protein ACFVH6_21780 [Spirillospora sp. NPDC127200]
MRLTTRIANVVRQAHARMFKSIFDDGAVLRAERVLDEAMDTIREERHQEAAEYLRIIEERIRRSQDAQTDDG